MKKTFLIISLILFSFSTYAQEKDRGLLEFSLGKVWGDFNQTHSNSVDSADDGKYKYKYDGTEFGIRVGKNWHDFVYGIDGKI